LWNLKSCAAEFCTRSSGVQHARPLANLGLRSRRGQNWLLSSHQSDRFGFSPKLLAGSGGPELGIRSLRGYHILGLHPMSALWSLARFLMESERSRIPVNTAQRKNGLCSLDPSAKREKKAIAKLLNARPVTRASQSRSSRRQQPLTWLARNRALEPFPFECALNVPADL
jgi:hypothetical protein